MTLPALLLAETAGEIEEKLDALLPRLNGADAPLAEACRIAALAGGKRVRPFLLLQSYAACGGTRGTPLIAAAALEAVHIYSLIHDDLPAMDDGLTRHGQPALHLQVGEGNALLAGNALFTYAFEWLAKEEVHPDPSCRLALVDLLASAANAMMRGQGRDLAAPEGADSILALHRLKTGALMGAACGMGAVLAEALPEQQQALVAFGEELGLAYQIRDDLVSHKDKAARRETAPSIGGALGEQAAEAECLAVLESALTNLASFGKAADNLAAFARWIFEPHDETTSSHIA